MLTERKTQPKTILPALPRAVMTKFTMHPTLQAISKLFGIRDNHQSWTIIAAVHAAVTETVKPTA